jgi:hypothetical protein
MYHDASLDALTTTFIKTTCKGQAWVGSKHDFAGNSWWHVKQVEQGSMDMTQSMKHQVEGPIMQENEWTRALGGATREARRQESHEWEMIMLGERTELGGPNHPRPVGPGRPTSPINGAPRLPSFAGK